MHSSFPTANRMLGFPCGSSQEFPQFSTTSPTCTVPEGEIHEDTQRRLERTLYCWRAGRCSLWQRWRFVVGRHRLRPAPPHPARTHRWHTAAPLLQPVATACSTARSSASSSTPARKCTSSRRYATPKPTRVASRLRDAYAPLEECTGLKVVYDGTDQFETEVIVRVDGGNPPDVIDFPQPGGFLDLIKKGQVFPFPDALGAAVTADNVAGWPELATVDGKVYGVPARANVKSLVWYSPKAFADKGYEIPTTLEELTALSDKIVADGGIPWCARHRVRCRHRLADHRLVRRLHDAHQRRRRVRPVGQPRDPVQRPEGEGSCRRRRRHRQEPRLHGRREPDQGRLRRRSSKRVASRS